MLVELKTFHGSEIHSCGSLCSADGICEIDTAPQSIEAVFTGRHETFQYTKVLADGFQKILHQLTNYSTVGSTHKVNALQVKYSFSDS